MFSVTNVIFSILVFGVTILIVQPAAFSETGNMLDFPIGLKVGDAANIDSELRMTLLEVEDSRCPSDVLCVWEGTVTAKVRLEKGTQDLGIHSISLTATEENEKTFDGYYIRLTNVEPYPESTMPIKPTDYVLTFFVSEGEKKQLDSPLKQFKRGIPVTEINCRDGFVLMIKSSDSTPSCVHPTTSEKLAARGWGQLSEDQSIQPIIKTGTNAGFCIGYCSKEFVITPEKITYTQSGRDFVSEKWQDLPQKTKEIPFSKAGWDKLVELIDFKKFNSLPDRIGCPGCADAPVEWIEITYDGKTKKIEFEQKDEIPEITDLISALQKIKSASESSINSFEECVLAGNAVMESYPRQCRTDDGKHFVEEIDTQPSHEILCDKYGGNWLQEFGECEMISEEQCMTMNGAFNECESACRHDPEAEVCTTQCVQVCAIP